MAPARFPRFLGRAFRLPIASPVVRRLPLRYAPLAERIARADRLLREGRFEDVDTLIRGLIDQGTAAVELLRLYAFSAHNSGRFTDACERWDVLRGRTPEDPMAWIGLAANLRELGRIVRAREVVDEARRRFPDDLVAVTEAVRIYDRLGDHEAVLRLWQRACDLRPSELHWVGGLVGKLAALDRLDEAEAAIRVREGSVASIASLRIAVEATQAMRRHDEETAHGLLQRLALGTAPVEVTDVLRLLAATNSLRFPEVSRLLYGKLAADGANDLTVLHGRVDSLMRCGRLVEAAAALDEALRVDPEAYLLRRDEAALAAKRERWADAITLYARLLEQRPDDREVREQLSRCRMDKAFVDAQADSLPDTDAAQRQDVGRVEDPSSRDLLLGFESLGQDCEFGLVQRRFGAEPLGLLRWNAVSPRTLVDALHARFDGLGDPAFTRIELWDDYEYYVTDTRWRFGFHSWISRHEMERELVFEKMCKRLAFLRGKLLSDLAGADKIFVCKCHDASADLMRDLLAALRTYGPATLLWVRSLESSPPGVDATACSVTLLEDGLMVGYLEGFGNRSQGPWQIAFDQWLALCRAAVRLRDRTDIDVEAAAFAQEGITPRCP